MRQTMRRPRVLTSAGVLAVLAAMTVAGLPAMTTAQDRTVLSPQMPPVDLNTATAEQLETLPGVGPSTAARIIEYREANNGFEKPEDLMNVRGIGERSFLRLRSLITITPPKVSGGERQR